MDPTGIKNSEQVFFLTLSGLVLPQCCLVSGVNSVFLTCFALLYFSISLSPPPPLSLCLCRSRSGVSNSFCTRCPIRSSMRSVGPHKWLVRFPLRLVFYSNQLGGGIRSPPQSGLDPPASRIRLPRSPDWTLPQAGCLTPGLDSAVIRVLFVQRSVGFFYVCVHACVCLCGCLSLLLEG